jgi:hypothetical protein
MRTDQKGERIMGATGHLGTAWRKRDYHRQWLWREANRLFDFFQNRAFNPVGGFHELDAEGRPLNPGNPVRGIHSTAIAFPLAACSAAPARTISSTTA